MAMHRAIGIVGAPSSIGARPYDDGEARHLYRAPGVLRDRGVVNRLDAIDFGDVLPPPYRDYVRPPQRVRNEAQLLRYSRSVAERVAGAASNGRFAVVLGGDCSVLLGCLLSAKRAAGGPVGLAYLDAHADFATPVESRTGSAAGMTLALATGHGDSPLARLAGRAPLVDGTRVAIVGRRDSGDASHGDAALSRSAILDLSDGERLTGDVGGAAAVLLEHVRAGVAGFWIQIDVDVLNPAVMSAVDSPEPGGLLPDELVALIGPLVRHPQAVGLSLTTYDPALDADRSAARQLIGLLEAIVGFGQH